MWATVSLALRASVTLGSLNSFTSNDLAALIERLVGLFVKKIQKEKKSFRFKEYSISVRPLKV